MREYNLCWNCENYFTDENNENCTKCHDKSRFIRRFDATSTKVDKKEKITSVTQ